MDNSIANIGAQEKKLVLLIFFLGPGFYQCFGDFRDLSALSRFGPVPTGRAHRRHPGDDFTTRKRQKRLYWPNF
jgi:hypothetical protein